MCPGEKAYNSHQLHYVLSVFLSLGQNHHPIPTSVSGGFGLVLVLGGLHTPLLQNGQCQGNQSANLKGRKMPYYLLVVRNSLYVY